MKYQKFSKPQKPKSPLAIRQVKGHSMLPILPPGILVYGWQWFSKLKPGDIIIFLHNGKEKIKRIKMIENNKLFVIGDHEGGSTDSRDFGWLEVDSVIAKIIWPRAPKH